MSATSEAKTHEVQITNLAVFSQFILERHLSDLTGYFVQESQLWSSSHEAGFENYSTEQAQLFENTEWLMLLSNNKATEYIDQALIHWLTMRFESKGGEILNQNIDAILRLRKKALINFIPSFTRDVSMAMALVNAIDSYVYHASVLLSKSTAIADKLLENQNFIHKIANATPSIIASYNINTGKYVFVNEGLKKLLGYDPKKALQDGIAFFIELIHPDDLQPIIEKNNAALAKANSDVTAQEIIAEFQYRMRHANGEYRWFHTFGTVFNRNKNNEVEHVLNISLDITERIKAEQVLYQRTLELQQSNANLEEFAFVASHDLKEPLRKISTFADRLLTSEKENFTGEGLTYLQKIRSSSVRLQHMINDLLSLSMISGDKSFKRTSLQKLWEEAVFTLDGKIEDTGAKITSDNLPDAAVVPTQIRQLFQNLLSNSLKFNSPEVQPIISITHKFLTAQDVAGLNLKSSKTYVQLTLSDNGIGFDNIYVEKIFAIFQRLHSKDTYEGTGIGLSICKKIIENHGGLILASATPGKGANFTIILPEQQLA